MDLRPPSRRAPTLETALRLLRAADYDLQLVKRITFRQVTGSRGRVVSVPSALPRLPTEQALSLALLVGPFRSRATAITGADVGVLMIPSSAFRPFTPV